MIVEPDREIVAIIGSRDFPKPKMVRDYITSDALSPKALVISGGARRGVDFWTFSFCIDIGHEIMVIPPPGPKHGWTRTYAQACAWRNAKIVELASRLIIFRVDHTKRSPGTDMVIKFAAQLAKPHEIFYP